MSSWCSPSSSRRGGVLAQLDVLLGLRHNGHGLGLDGGLVLGLACDIVRDARVARSGWVAQGCLGIIIDAAAAETNGGSNARHATRTASMGPSCIFEGFSGAAFVPGGIVAAIAAMV